ncbi:MAG: prolipoprotein diacylglyceryl transferase, partial [Lachnospiraceae bacterium]|nr:prolipoprotein diacylglyceryl transferase [Lachnospiraceae bacterium]
FNFGDQLKNITAGFVIYGGLILGVLCCLFYVKKIRKTSFIRIFDIAAPSIAIGQGIGRIGCFLAGCCFGKEIPAGHWLSFIGVVFPNEALCEAPAGVLLWPTQLMSVAGDLLLAAFLIWYTDRERFAGEVSVFYIGLYAIGRFLIEFLRGDEVRGFVGVLSTSQFIAVIMLVLAVVLWFVFKKIHVEPLRPVGAYVKPDEDDEDEDDYDEDEEEDEEDTGDDVNESNEKKD